MENSICSKSFRHHHLHSSSSPLKILFHLPPLLKNMSFGDDGPSDDWIMNYFLDDSLERQIELVLQLYGPRTSSKRKHKNRGTKAAKMKGKEKTGSKLNEELEAIRAATERKLSLAEELIAAKIKEIDIRVITADTTNLTPQQLKVHDLILEKIKPKYM